MKKNILIIMVLAFLTGYPSSGILAAGTPLPTPEGCKVTDRRCILDTIAGINKGNLENPDYSLWIGLQVPIPAPNCMSLDNVLCKDGFIVGVKNIASLITVLFQFAMTMIAIFLVVLMVIGGGMYVTSGGDAGKASTAMEMIKNASYSMIVLFFSVIILYQINPKLINPNFEAGTIRQTSYIIDCFDQYQVDCSIEYESNLVRSTVTTGKCSGKRCDNKKYCGTCGSNSSDPACSADNGPIDPNKLTCLLALKAGENCTAHNECLSNFCLDGLCNDPPIGKSCTLPNDCNGLVCESLGADTCSYGRTGADCSNDTECAEGYFCWDYPSNGVGAACVPKTTAFFQVCDSDTQCGSGMECKNFICVAKNDSGFCDIDESCKNMANNDPDVRCLTTAPSPGVNNSITRFCSNQRAGSACVSDANCKSNICLEFGNGKRQVCSDGLVGDFCKTPKDCRSELRCVNDTCQN